MSLIEKVNLSGEYLFDGDPVKINGKVELENGIFKGTVYDLLLKKDQLLIGHFVNMDRKDYIIFLKALRPDYKGKYANFFVANKKNLTKTFKGDYEGYWAFIDPTEFNENFDDFLKEVNSKTQHGREGAHIGIFD